MVLKESGEEWKTAPFEGELEGEEGEGDDDDRD